MHFIAAGRPLACFWRVSSLGVWSSDLCFLLRQLLVQILSADAEDARRLGLVAARGLKHLAYVLGLKLCERRSPCLTSARADRSPDRLRQIIRAHRLPLRDDDGAFDDVREFAHVAGEVVSRERGARLRVEAARR